MSIKLRRNKVHACACSHVLQSGFLFALLYAVSIACARIYALPNTCLAFCAYVHTECAVPMEQQLLLPYAP